MKRINILDEHTSNKIAAGEVVERPASVVKELVENSIDAGAKNITIEIEEGGIELIRVIDDGVGIYADDISKAFLPHATSKIVSVDDIYNINTLGFRGEALPSIASVSQVNFRSKTADANFGKEISISAGEVLSINDIGMNTGSIMEVRNLFFNVPARKKFLKTTSREGSLVNDIVTRIALSYPDISFKLFNNNKKVLLTYGDNNLASTIRTIYGKTIYEDIIEFSNHEDSYIRIYGYVGRESIARGSRNNQSIYVNNRYIKNKTVVAAVENAFKSFSTVNKFPFFVLFIDIPADNIDVNIHPTKAEIKFKDERMIFKAVFDTVHSALKNDVFNSFATDQEQLNVDVNIQSPLLIEEQHISDEKREQIDLLETKSSLLKEPSINDIYSSVTMNDIKKEENIYNELKAATVAKNTIKNDVPIEPTVNYEETSYSQSYTENSYEEQYEPKEKVDEKVPVAKFADLRVIGQFNKTYILAEYLDCLYIIDQHAAHEKILFEKYRNDIEEKSTIIQPLLIPMVLELSIDDYECYIENKSLFEESGFIIDEFGDNTISLKEVPYFLGKLDSKKLFLDMIDNLKNMGSGKTVEVKINKIASMACRAAVKANDYLTEIEMKELIEQLRYIEDPFHCPHGRPIIIKMTNYELDKKFKRIV
ncbi:MAG: DNA mismatch repair endonuclease MutL [Clostridium sp.]|uniref:DNA mismatch repair endonuclease MutL n=1 Tax=Clostridium sp. TaxID=1506 RepID=UPI00267369F4|nr:DNA mismatch repair endonuclease MutL [Clostridium sp.]MCI7029792.1 DNA mismatch repair endonuclease MutL [Clostridium sp.]MDD7681587.1 DNA mismatch repair endonuclease MutL [Clostridium sp.]MDY2579151.1 DNA mismatch repair endonuclease MutL [Clostridium sp.]